MPTRRTLTLSTAAAALAWAGPALAQPGAPYEYAEPLPPGAVIYDSQPIIQPVPLPPAPPAPPEMPYEDDYGDGYAGNAALPPPPPLERHHPLPEHEISHGYRVHAPPYPGAYAASGYAPPLPPRFDRDAWLAQCNDRIRGVARKDRAGVIGGLLGGIAGGVVGNRAWDSERLAGTLLGAGIGGLAGVAIGSAIGAAGERRREDECAWHLDRHMASFPQGPAYGYPSYGYGYPAIAYVPVLVQVPQRAIVREYVTEEWVDGPARSETITETTVVRQPASAPRADKRIKLIKGR